MKSESSKTLYVLTGPTAVGKTELALQWAERNEAEIVNADAFCFYRGMDIGTAKPDFVERQRVPHHCLDFLDVMETSSVVDYHRRAQQAVDEIAARGRRVLITGGSGFYLQSFFKALSDGLTEDPEVKRAVQLLFDREGLEGALAALHECNPDGLGNLDVRNPRRVLAALRRCLQTGKTVTALLADLHAQPEPFSDWNKRLVVLQRPDDELFQRIDRRVAQMLQNGLLEEVQALRAQGLAENPVAASAIGYREVLRFLRSHSEDLDALAEMISQNTRKLVRKQQAWFRNQCPGAQVMPAATATPANLFPESA